jgi:hypothetical protein
VRLVDGVRARLVLVGCREPPQHRLRLGGPPLAQVGLDLALVRVRARVRVRVRVRG